LGGAVAIGLAITFTANNGIINAVRQSTVFVTLKKCISNDFSGYMNDEKQ